MDDAQPERYEYPMEGVQRFLHENFRAYRRALLIMTVLRVTLVGVVVMIGLRLVVQSPTGTITLALMYWLYGAAEYGYLWFEGRRVRQMVELYGDSESML